MHRRVAGRSWLDPKVVSCVGTTELMHEQGLFMRNEDSLVGNKGESKDGQRVDSDTKTHPYGEYALSFQLSQWLIPFVTTHVLSDCQTGIRGSQKPVVDNHGQHVVHPLHFCLSVQAW